ncbi:ABC transporter substrate-binding protein [Desulfopila sp. IMCC35008]|uniref:ABC transporter substrate-binding protein n=1 Tax=Desulfopila sp. IMCC35008 TaxID=2653858 RepID=UPI0013D0A487|nr:ABC transporter substrate-binding protein [Desulfopila sp. IMCC35008]
MKVLVLLVIVIATLQGGSVNWGYAKDLHVTFLNPGSTKDVGVWHLVSHFMQAAADDLDIALEILYADRNHIKMLNQAKQVANSTKAPDYVIMVNEKLMGKEMLLLFKNSNSKIFFIHNGLTDKQRKEVGNERVTIKNWIGTIATDEYQAGYKLIKELYRSMKAYPKILGITGTKATPVSLIRLKGVEDYIVESGRGEQVQVAYGKWSYEDGKQKALALLKRYDDINMIWAANDSMAMGAYDAAQEVAPQRKILVGGLGGFPDTLESIKKGGMKATVGGTVMTGAWSLILINDHHFGLDFNGDLGANIKVDHSTVINTAAKADRFTDVVLNHPEEIDFRKFSKKFNSSLTQYDFSYEKVCQASKLLEKE